MITLTDLRHIMPYASAGRASTMLEYINAAMSEFEITIPLRAAHWLAQLAHESGSLRYMRELASGEAYEGREDLGNILPGDGRKFPGRGPIQITGRRNTGLVSYALFGDDRLMTTPELLELPENAFRSAGWFWRIGAGLNLSSRAKQHGIPVGCDLNSYADDNDIESITLAVNGGMNGYDDRMKFFERAQTVLKGTDDGGTDGST